VFERSYLSQGFDDAGRPVMLCNLAAHQPSQDKKERQKELVWCMEHLVALSDRNSQTSGGKTIIIFDLQGYTLENVDTEDAAAIVDILQVCACSFLLPLSRLASVHCNRSENTSGSRIRNGLEYFI
jgi:CRAL/TRIO domain